jgi:hypothetical protein
MRDITVRRTHAILSRAEILDATVKLAVAMASGTTEQDIRGRVGAILLDDGVQNAFAAWVDEIRRLPEMAAVVEAFGETIDDPATQDELRRVIVGPPRAVTHFVAPVATADWPCAFGG